LIHSIRRSPLWFAESYPNSPYGSGLIYKRLKKTKIVVAGKLPT